MPPTISTHQLSELIGRIYDCTLDPGQWEATLTAINDLLRVTQGDWMIDVKAGQQALLAFVKDLEAGEDHSLSTHDSTGSVSIEPLAVPRDRPSGSPSAPRQRATGASRHGDKRLFSVGGAASEAGVTRSGLGAGQATLLGLLLPHLRRAAEIISALDTQLIAHHRLVQALDCLRARVVLVSPDRRVVFANESARAFIEGSRHFDLRGDRFRARRAQTDLEITKAVRCCIELENATHNIRISRLDEPVVLAHVVPVMVANGDLPIEAADAVVAILMTSLESDSAGRAATMRRLFKLTPAETRLLERLLSGETVVEAADHLAIAHATARVQLRGIFSKTGVSRQAELIRLAATLSPVRTS